MVSWRIRLLVAFAGLLAAATTVLAMHMSPWFLWESLPPGDIRLAAVHPVASALLSERLLSSLAPEIVPYQNDVRAFALTKHGDSFTFIAYPISPFNRSVQHEIASQLRRDGWQVSRRGLLIVAQDHAGNLPSIPVSLWRTVRQSLRLARPLAIAEVKAGALPNYHEPLAAMMTGRGSEVTIIAGSAPLSRLPREAGERYPFPAAADLSFSVPGTALAALPPALLAEWNEILIDQFNFKYTSPNLLATAAQHDSVAVSMSREATSFGANGRSDVFIKSLTETITAEEAYLRPEQRAFRLPDGTIGREVVPGQPRAAASPSPGSCIEALSLTVCTNQAAATIATTRGAAEKALQTAPWHVVIGEQYLKAAGLPLKAVSAIGDVDRAVIRLKLGQ